VISQKSVCGNLETEILRNTRNLIMLLLCRKLEFPLQKNPAILLLKAVFCVKDGKF